MADTGAKSFADQDIRLFFSLVFFLACSAIYAIVVTDSSWRHRVGQAAYTVGAFSGLLLAVKPLTARIIRIIDRRVRTTPNANHLPRASDITAKIGLIAFVLGVVIALTQRPRTVVSIAVLIGGGLITWVLIWNVLFKITERSEQDLSINPDPLALAENLGLVLLLLSGLAGFVALFWN